MPKASVTRLIERDKAKLINFVLDIEKYPEFIPFCIDSKVYEKKELSSTQLSSLKTIVSKNQVYYLHYVLVLFEILVIIFLMRSFRSRSG